MNFEWLTAWHCRKSERFAKYFLTTTRTKEQILALEFHIAKLFLSCILQKCKVECSIVHRGANSSKSIQLSKVILYPALCKSAKWEGSIVQWGVIYHRRGHTAYLSPVYNSADLQLMRRKEEAALRWLLMDKIIQKVYKGGWIDMIIFIHYMTLL